MSVAWITGASSGIGEALARRLARDGRRVVVSARSADALARLAAECDGRVHAHPLDVTDPEACAAAIDMIEAQHGEIALAVLNAGTHLPTPLAQFTVAAVRSLVEVNLMGVVNGLAPTLARMRERRRGHVAVVASIAGYGGLPTAGAYGATKAALINLCEALRPECERAGINLQLVCPGFVRTPLTDRNPFPMPFLMEVEDAIDRLVAGLASDRFEIIFPWRFAMMVKAFNLLPYPLYLRALRRIASR